MANSHLQKAILLLLAGRWFFPSRAGRIHAARAVRKRLSSTCNKIRIVAEDRESKDVEVSYRISEGQPADIEQYPSLVQVEFYNDYTGFWVQDCAANILNEFYVLSAAHCFSGDGGILSHRRIRAGTSARNYGGVVVNVENAFIHPYYGRLGFDSDLAVVRLSSALQFSSTIKPADVVYQDSVIPDNTEVKAAGWGATSQNGLSPDVLQDITIYTINNELCAQRSLMSNSYAVTENMICAGLLDIGGKDVCPGDSGGGLFHENILIGVVSWGNGCANPYFPGVYTNIASYRDWIESIVDNS